MDDCLFCKIVAGEIPSRRVYEDETAVAFLDVAPLHRGHTLVVPRQHVADLTEDAAVLASIAPAVSAVTRLLVDRLGADGANVLSNVGEVAGQSVFHLHVHVVPRWADQPGMAGLLQGNVTADPDEVLAQITGA